MILFKILVELCLIRFVFVLYKYENLVKKKMCVKWKICLGKFIM